MYDESYSIVQLDINEICLNLENPRFNKVESQEEAISIMLTEYGEKIYTLAKHIIENGINPTEYSTVIKKDEIYIALDGNRRITTLKILCNPELLNNNFEKLKSKILKLDRSNIPTKINAVEFFTEEEANIWINLKHTGENGGIGTVGWNAIQQSRFNNDKYPLSIQLLKYMENYKLLDKTIAPIIKDLKISNLERLLTDPDVRDVLSISRVKNELHFPIPNDDIKNILNNLLSDLLTDDFTVNIIRNKVDRIEYIESFKHRYNLTEKNLTDMRNREITTVKQLESSIKDDKKSLEGKEDIKTEVAQLTNKEKPHIKVPTPQKRLEYSATNSRDTLIPKNVSLQIKNTKINDIYKELKKIKIDEYTNIIGAAFRVFLELSIDYYMYEEEIEIGKHDTLNIKLNKVKDDINIKLNLDKNELKNISRAISSNTNIVSIDVLHGYVHSTMAQASADGLKITWNNYEHFIKLLYEVLNK